MSTELGVTKGQLTTLVKDIRQTKKKVKRNFDDLWPTYDSTRKSYETTFPGFSFRDFLKNRKNPLVIDLLSSTRAIRSMRGFHSNDQKGIAVSLQDHRWEIARRYDARLNISHLSGDLSDIETWNRLEEELNGKKADLIIERGLAGLLYLPDNNLFLLFALRRIWNMLSPEGGTFLAKGHHLGSTSLNSLSTNNVFFSSWMENARKEGVDIKFEDAHPEQKYLTISKHPDSPQHLPYIGRTTFSQGR